MHHRRAHTTHHRHKHKKKHKKTKKHSTHVTPAAEPATNLIRGVTIAYGGSEAEIQQEVNEAKVLHAQVVRLNLSWASLEPEHQGQIEQAGLRQIDTVVHTAAADGLRVVVLVQSTPCWASSAPLAIEAECNPHHAGAANAWPPSNDSYYGDFLAELARRYGNELAAIEIWNEPDYAGENYLAGPDKAGEYAGLLKAAYPAIKAADPNIAVLAGSLVGSNGVFLRDLYADGIKGYYDGLAVHFYTLTLTALRSIHAIQLENGDNTPLWLDEFGFPSCAPTSAQEAEQSCVTQGIQATDIANIVHSAVRLPYVASTILYKLRDTAGNEFGVLSANGARKPAFASLASAFATPFASPSPVVLHLGPQAGGVLAFGGGPVGSVMELEVFKSGHLLYGLTFTLNVNNTFSTRLPASLGTTGLTVRLYQLGTSPTTAAQLSI